MKRKFLHAAAAVFAAVFCLTAHGCDGDTTVVGPQGTATVALKRESVAVGSFTVTFTPSENTVRYRYAMGRETDRATFEAGTLAGTTEQSGNESLTAEFTGLVSGQTYTVFACAYDDSGTAGTVASLKVATFREDFYIETRYVTCRSAAFTVTAGMDWYKFRWAVASASDRQAFADGTLAGEEVIEAASWTIGDFGLLPGSEYVLYVQPCDRLGIAGPLYEVPITTPAEDGFPSVVLDVPQIDVYQGTYRLTPNPLCGRIDAVAFPADAYDVYLKHEKSYAGDVMDMVIKFVQGNILGSTAQDGPLEIQLQLPYLLPGIVMDVYAVAYDNDCNPDGVYKFSPSLSEYDPDAGKAECAETVSGITAAGADCTYIPNQHTLGVLYEILEADWWDGFVESDDYYEGWLQQYFMSEGYWKYTPTHRTFTYTESKAKPGTRYYAAACPINVNGADGFGETTLAEFTTLEL